MGPKKDNSKEKPKAKSKNVNILTGATANMVKSALKFILTKFVKKQTALMKIVTKGIPTLANLALDVDTKEKISAFTLM